MESVADMRLWKKHNSSDCSNTDTLSVSFVFFFSVGSVANQNGLHDVAIRMVEHSARRGAARGGGCL